MNGQWTKLLVVALPFCNVACLAQAAAPVPAHKNAFPAVHLEGDTRACHGRFNLTPTSLQWTSTWSRCTVRSPHLLSKDASTWAFESTPTKSCPFAVIELVNVTDKQQLPKSDYPLWQVNGFHTLEGYKQHPEQTDLGCNMQ